jgi:hypothetical protein
VKKSHKITQNSAKKIHFFARKAYVGLKWQFRCETKVTVYFYLIPASFAPNLWLFNSIKLQKVNLYDNSKVPWLGISWSRTE